MEIIKQKKFGNGNVYALRTKTGKIVETTDTFLPYYTKNAINQNCNNLITKNFGNRSERWMIGVSTMSGCPVGCKFCATGNKFNGNLTSEEIIEQVEFIVNQNPDYDPYNAKEFKILLTRMGEPALNYLEVNKAICCLKEKYPEAAISISTIGVDNPALDSWLELSKKYKNIHMQFSIHTTSEEQRNLCVPLTNKLRYQQMKEFGNQWMKIPNNQRKIALNFTLIDKNEFDIKKLKEFFPKENFFVKLSPLNENRITIKNNLKGVITKANLL